MILLPSFFLVSLLLVPKYGRRQVPLSPVLIFRVIDILIDTRDLRRHNVPKFYSKRSTANIS
jgi:hypothetical protein